MKIIKIFAELLRIKPRNPNPFSAKNEGKQRKQEAKRRAKLNLPILGGMTRGPGDVVTKVERSEEGATCVIYSTPDGNCIAVTWYLMPTDFGGKLYIKTREGEKFSAPKETTPEKSYDQIMEAAKKNGFFGEIKFAIYDNCQHYPILKYVNGRLVLSWKLFGPDRNILGMLRGPLSWRWYDFISDEECRAFAKKCRRNFIVFQLNRFEIWLRRACKFFARGMKNYAQNKAEGFIIAIIVSLCLGILGCYGISMTMADLSSVGLGQ